MYIQNMDLLSMIAQCKKVKLGGCYKNISI